MTTRAEYAKSIPCFRAVDTNVAAVNLGSISVIIGEWIRRREQTYVCLADVHAIMQAHWNSDVRRIQAQAGLVTADGMPLVWLGRLLGHATVARVYGPDLLVGLARFGLGRGYRHFFYGGYEGVAERLARYLKSSVPGVNICGVIAPPRGQPSFDEAEAFVREINGARPDIVWVGLGAPKQERWMAENRDRLDAPVLIGVGAAFDFLSGAKRQAPLWMQRSGLEWSFRLATEPRRLAARYFQCIPTFVALVGAQLLRQQWSRLRRTENIH
jgi:N-acetylglucosaminyldiphosphoundecaprenol N-acetyl-beta-D-mannosaminyltransferase